MTFPPSTLATLRSFFSWLIAPPEISGILPRPPNSFRFPIRSTEFSDPWKSSAQLQLLRYLCSDLTEQQEKLKLLGFRYLRLLDKDHLKIDSGLFSFPQLWPIISKEGTPFNDIDVLGTGRLWSNGPVMIRVLGYLSILDAVRLSGVSGRFFEFFWGCCPSLWGGELVTLPSELARCPIAQRRKLFPRVSGAIALAIEPAVAMTMTAVEIEDLVMNSQDTLESLQLSMPCHWLFGDERKMGSVGREGTKSSRRLGLESSDAPGCRFFEVADLMPLRFPRLSQIELSGNDAWVFAGLIRQWTLNYPVGLVLQHWGDATLAEQGAESFAGGDGSCCPYGIRQLACSKRRVEELQKLIITHHTVIHSITMLVPGGLSEEQCQRVLPRVPLMQTGMSILDRDYPQYIRRLRSSGHDAKSYEINVVAPSAFPDVACFSDGGATSAMADIARYFQLMAPDQVNSLCSMFRLILFEDGFLPRCVQLEILGFDNFNTALYALRAAAIAVRLDPNPPLKWEALRKHLEALRQSKEGIFRDPTLTAELEFRKYFTSMQNHVILPLINFDDAVDAELKLIADHSSSDFENSVLPLNPYRVATVHRLAQETNKLGPVLTSLHPMTAQPSPQPPPQPPSPFESDKNWITWPNAACPALFGRVALIFAGTLQWPAGGFVEATVLYPELADVLMTRSNSATEPQQELHLRIQHRAKRSHLFERLLTEIDKTRDLFLHPRRGIAAKTRPFRKLVVTKLQEAPQDVNSLLRVASHAINSLDIHLGDGTALCRPFCAAHMPCLRSVRVVNWNEGNKTHCKLFKELRGAPEGSQAVPLTVTVETTGPVFCSVRGGRRSATHLKAVSRLVGAFERQGLRVKKLHLFPLCEHNAAFALHHFYPCSRIHLSIPSRKSLARQFQEKAGVSVCAATLILTQEDVAGLPHLSSSDHVPGIDAIREKLAAWTTAEHPPRWWGLPSYAQQPDVRSMALAWAGDKPHTDLPKGLNAYFLASDLGAFARDGSFLTRFHQGFKNKSSILSGSCGGDTQEWLWLLLSGIKKLAFTVVASHPFEGLRLMMNAIECGEQFWCVSSIIQPWLAINENNNMLAYMAIWILGVPTEIEEEVYRLCTDFPDAFGYSNVTSKTDEGRRQMIFTTVNPRGWNRETFTAVKRMTATERLPNYIKESQLI